MRRPLFQHRNVFAQSCVCRWAQANVCLAIAQYRLLSIGWTGYLVLTSGGSLAISLPTEQPYDAPRRVHSCLRRPA